MTHTTNTTAITPTTTATSRAIKNNIPRTAVPIDLCGFVTPPVRERESVCVYVRV